jgi:hypothetical protein
MIRPHRPVFLAVAALALALAAAPSAQAFQFENADGSAATPPRNFMDLGMPSATAGASTSKFKDDKTAPADDGFNVQFHQGPFGGSSFHQRYNFDAQFDRYNGGLH